MRSRTAAPAASSSGESSFIGIFARYCSNARTADFRDGKSHTSILIDPQYRHARSTASAAPRTPARLQDTQAVNTVGRGGFGGFGGRFLACFGAVGFASAGFAAAAGGLAADTFGGGGCFATSAACFGAIGFATSAPAAGFATAAGFGADTFGGGAAAGRTRRRSLLATFRFVQASLTPFVRAPAASISARPAATSLSWRRRW